MTAQDRDQLEAELRDALGHCIALLRRCAAPSMPWNAP
jgi:hypothetical protein